MDRHRRSHVHHQRVRRQVEKVVFVTATPTFSGPIAGFTTVGVPAPSTPRPKPASSSAPPPKVNVNNDKTSVKSTPKPKPTPPPTTTAKTIVGPPKAFSTTSEKPRSTVTDVDDEDEVVSSTKTRASLTETFETSIASNTVDAIRETSATPTPTAISQPQESSGGGIGTYAGIVAGVVAVVLALLVLVAYIYRKRKQKVMNEAYGKPEEEKFGAVAGGFSEKQQERPSAAEKAPRLSLRPVTQFLPNLNSGPTPAPGPQNKGLLPVTQEVVRKPVPAPLNLAPAPVIGHSEQNRDSNNSPVPVVMMPAAQPSPTLSAFSDGSAPTPGTPTSGAIGGGDPTPVYRIMMDFKPSQGDELELRAGNLVRMLHEYDDGWVLAVRMDRSQQGVCPRTCLSPRPVQPRARPGPGSAPGSPGGPNQQRRGPPRNIPPANSRPPYAANPNRAQSPGPQNFPRPQSPANQQRQQRPQSPVTAYRPQTPTQQRPMTPTQQQLPQITVSLSPEAPAPRSPPRSPPSGPIAANPTPQPKEPSPLGQQQGPVFHAM